jgi:hypothetical protein
MSTEQKMRELDVVANAYYAAGNVVASTLSGSSGISVALYRNNLRGTEMESVNIEVPSDVSDNGEVVVSGSIARRLFELTQENDPEAFEDAHNHSLMEDLGYKGKRMGEAGMTKSDLTYLKIFTCSNCWRKDRRPPELIGRTSR